jgi:hypothetical protein
VLENAIKNYHIKNCQACFNKNCQACFKVLENAIKNYHIKNCQACFKVVGLFGGW